MLTTSTTKPEEQEEKEETSFVCPEASGIFANPSDCTKFWHCSNYVPFMKVCPGQLVFNDVINSCSWSSNLCKSKNIYNANVNKPKLHQTGRNSKKQIFFK